jgi:hypothetical protein
MDSGVTHDGQSLGRARVGPGPSARGGQAVSAGSLLLITIAAMLAGRRDRLGIVRWGRRLNHETLQAIGIGRDRVPRAFGVV